MDVQSKNDFVNLRAGSRPARRHQSIINYQLKGPAGQEQTTKKLDGEENLETAKRGNKGIPLFDTWQRAFQLPGGFVLCGKARVVIFY
jgi:hypothetical protein